MYYWFFRRHIFLFCRWFDLPVSVAAKIKTTFKPVWVPIEDPASNSVNDYVTGIEQRGLKTALK